MSPINDIVIEYLTQSVDLIKKNTQLTKSECER